MSKYDISYSCGHDATVNIQGPTKDRQRKADYMAEGLCKSCYAQKRKDDDFDASILRRQAKSTAKIVIYNNDGSVASQPDAIMSHGVDIIKMTDGKYRHCDNCSECHQKNHMTIRGGNYYYCDACLPIVDACQG